MADNGPTLVVIDDDHAAAALAARLAEKLGFDVALLAEQAGFAELAPVDQAHTIVLALPPHGQDGGALLRELARRKVPGRVVIVSELDEQTRLAAEEYGRQHGLDVVASVAKPFFPEEFLQLLRATLVESVALTAGELEAAIAAEQLFVVYLPTVRRFGAIGWRIDSMEALLRWDHPGRGVLGPDEFLDLAHDSGLIDQITAFVIRQALQQLADWQAAHIGVGLRLNLSARQLTDWTAPELIDRTIGKLGIDPGRLTLEIADTAMLDGRPGALDVLTLLRHRHIRLAIDDFGTGHAPLMQLCRLPFDEMKIDRSLIEQVGTSRESRIMVQALVDLAHKLGLTVCAEGVASEAALDFLGEIECEAAQGYFISYPLEPRAVIEMVGKNRDLIESRAPARFSER